MVLAKHKLKKDSDKNVKRKTSSKLTNNNVKFSRDIDLFEQKITKNKSIRESINENNRSPKIKKINESLVYDNSSIKYRMNSINNQSLNPMSMMKDDKNKEKYIPYSVINIPSNKIEKCIAPDNLKDNNENNNSKSSSLNYKIEENINENKLEENLNFNKSSDFSYEENSASSSNNSDLIYNKKKSNSANFRNRFNINLENNIDKKSKFLTNIIQNINDIYILPKNISNGKNSEKSSKNKDEDNKKEEKDANLFVLEDSENLYDSSDSMESP
jgi:hypothetical protein